MGTKNESKEHNQTNRDSVEQYTRDILKLELPPSFIQMIKQRYDIDIQNYVQPAIVDLCIAFDMLKEKHIEATNQLKIQDSYINELKEFQQSGKTAKAIELLKGAGYKLSISAQEK